MKKVSIVNIPLNAKVYCTDGFAGRFITTILDPISQETTHLVVVEKQSPAIKRLIPLTLVKKTTSQLILLGICKKITCAFI
jgi:hypothetical protein